MTQPCTHTPGIVRTIVQGDERRATCTSCGVELSSLFDDYDGDGAWHWTRWQPAPIPVTAGPVPSTTPTVQGTVRALRPAS